MTLVVLIIGLIAFGGGASLRHQQMRRDPVGGATPGNGFAEISALSEDVLQIKPFAWVALGAVLILVFVIGMLAT